MVQLSLSGFQANFDARALAALREEFREFHTFQIRQFLSPEFYSAIIGSLPDSDFKPRPHGKIAMELAVDGQRNLAVHSLQLRMNDLRLNGFLRDVSGIDSLRHFSGRIYRMLPGGDHYDSWHDDVTDGRRLGVSINLG